MKASALSIYLYFLSHSLAQRDGFQVTEVDGSSVDTLNHIALKLGRRDEGSKAEVQNSVQPSSLRENGKSEQFELLPKATDKDSTVSSPTSSSSPLNVLDDWIVDGEFNNIAVKPVTGDDNLDTSDNLLRTEEARGPRIG